MKDKLKEIILRVKREYSAEAEIRAELCLEVLSDFSNEALESGVVGEMVEAIKKANYDMTHGWYWITESKVESILSKLEADNG